MSKKMTPKQAVDKIREIPDSCTEEWHIKADRLMCDILVENGYSELVDIFRNRPKWYAQG